MARSRTIKTVLVAGASGQLGRELSRQLVDAGYRVRALIHKTPLEMAGVECVRGDVGDLAAVIEAMRGMDAVCQLATTKEDPGGFIDVSIRGTWNLLEAARQLGTVRRWILAGGDAAMGIYHFRQPCAINENMPHRAYPGCYAFSKVIEEVMGQQYFIQYGVPYVCLRCSWILHEGMILKNLSTRPWQRHLTAAQTKTLDSAKGEPRIAVILGADGSPLVRHVVALKDAAGAFLLALEHPAATGQTFNIAAAAPFAYDVAGEYLSGKTGAPMMRINVPEAHDFTIDISKARSVLGYQPKYDIFGIIDDALAWQAKRDEAAKGS